MGQTSTEAKREVEQTRAHLGETLEALQLRAKRNLDLKTQLQTNHVLQLVVGTLVLAVTGFAVFGYRTRRRRSTAEQLARKLKLNDLRDRLEEFRDDAKAWASAQKRIVKANGKTKVEVQSKESIGRRLLIGAAEAAITALAAGYARRLVSGSSTPPHRLHPRAGPWRTRAHFGQGFPPPLGEGRVGAHGCAPRQPDQHLGLRTGSTGSGSGVIG